MRNTFRPTSNLAAAAWEALLARSSEALLLVDDGEQIVAASVAAAHVLGTTQDSLTGIDVRGHLGLAPSGPLCDCAALPAWPTLALRYTPLRPAGALLTLIPSTPHPHEIALVYGREQRLREVLMTIASALDIDQILDDVVRLSIEISGADAGSLPLYDQERDEVIVDHLVNLEAAPRRGSVQARGVGLIWQIIDNAQPALFNDYASEPGALPLLLSHEVCAVVAVPVLAGAQVLGVLALYHRGPGVAFTPYDLELLQVIGRQTGIAIQNARLFARIQQLATLDPLTAVPNRRHFYEIAAREAERAARYNHPLSAIMIDADHFKAINDSYGHIAGDQVLQAIAARCRSDLREVDLLARFGGEEFVVLLPETDHAQALLVAHRLAARIADTPIITEAGPIVATISLGVASAPPARPFPLEALLDAADQALYRAKRAGRNQVSG